MRKARAGGAGFTMIEVLVTLVLLSFGALGGAVLQMNALKATHSAYQRSLASIFAADAGERLWHGLARGQIDTDWLADWQQQRNCPEANGHVCLPEFEVMVDGIGNRQVITVSWAEVRFQEPDERASLEYVMEALPQW